MYKITSTLLNMRKISNQQLNHLEKKSSNERRLENVRIKQAEAKNKSMKGGLWGLK